MFIFEYPLCGGMRLHFSLNREICSFLREAASSNNLYYLSMASGITQIHFKQLDANSSIQLSNFSREEQIVHFDVTKNGKYIAVSYFHRTEIYLNVSNTMKLVKTFEELVFPDFSSDSKRLLLSKVTPYGTSTSIEFDLSDFKETGISIPDAIFSLYFKHGILFVKYQGTDNTQQASNKTSIHLFDYKSIELLNDEIQLHYPSRLATDGDRILAIDQVDDQIKSIDFHSKKVTIIKAEEPRKITLSGNNLIYTQANPNKTDIYVGKITKRQD